MHARAEQDILFNTGNKCHISKQPCNILYVLMDRTTVTVVF